MAEFQSTPVQVCSFCTFILLILSASHWGNILTNKEQEKLCCRPHLRSCPWSCWPTLIIFLRSHWETNIPLQLHAHMHYQLSALLVLSSRATLQYAIRPARQWSKLNSSMKLSIYVLRPTCFNIFAPQKIPIFQMGTWFSYWLFLQHAIQILFTFFWPSTATGAPCNINSRTIYKLLFFSMGTSSYTIRGHRLWKPRTDLPHYQTYGNKMSPATLKMLTNSRSLGRKHRAATLY